MNCDSTCMAARSSMATPMGKAATYWAPSQNMGALSSGGQCGASSGSILTGTPSSFLCSTGTASAVQTTSSDGETTYSWTCTNQQGSSSCNARLREVGSCGSSNGQSVTSTPQQLCSSGGSSNFTLVGSIYTWNCTGNYGSAAKCSAALAPSDPYKSYPTTFTDVCGQACQSRAYYNYLSGFDPYNVPTGGYYIQPGSGAIVSSVSYTGGVAANYIYNFSSLEAAGYKIYVISYAAGNGNNYNGQAYTFRICKNC